MSAIFWDIFREKTLSSVKNNGIWILSLALGQGKHDISILSVNPTRPINHITGDHIWEKADLTEDMLKN